MRQYDADEIIALVESAKAPKSAADIFEENGEAHGRRDTIGEIRKLLATVAAYRKTGVAQSEEERWYLPMRSATAKMIGLGWSDDLIKLTCAPYCDKGFDDPDLPRLIDGARMKWGKPDPGEAGGTEGDTGSTRTEAKSASPALKLTYFGEFGDKAKKRPILKGFLNKGETLALSWPRHSGRSCGLKLRTRCFDIS